jgi:hypothetical protein
MNLLYILKQQLLVVFVCILCVTFGVRVRGMDTVKPNDIGIDDNPINMTVVDEKSRLVSTNVTTVSYEAHVTFSSRYDSYDMTRPEMEYFNHALIQAFDQSNIVFFSYTTTNNTKVLMIDAKMKHPDKNNTEQHKHVIGHGLHRNLSYRLRGYWYYRVYSYTVIFDFGCGNLCGDKSGFWDRRRRTMIKKSTSLQLEKFATKFGRKLCTLLRGSSYGIFKTVKHCAIRF